jgi:hypothetical protein
LQPAHRNDAQVFLLRAREVPGLPISRSEKTGYDPAFQERTMMVWEIQGQDEGEEGILQRGIPIKPAR